MKFTERWHDLFEIECILVAILCRCTFALLFPEISVLPHGDVRIVPHQLLRQNLHMDVCVVELLPHLPQLAHSIMQVALPLAPAERTGDIGKDQLHPFTCLQ